MPGVNDGCQVAAKLDGVTTKSQFKRRYIGLFTGDDVPHSSEQCATMLGLMNLLAALAVS